MHPILILLPAAALVLGPKLWVNRVLKQHAQKEEFPDTAAELARRWLDSNHLQAVGIEITDQGDHYDPESKTVRLSRDRYAGKTLTAITTVAHEVSHALQDAADYAPFVWRNRLGQLSMAVGQVGTILLVSVPVAALLTRRPIPPVMVGSTLVLMLGTGLAAQLTALYSELDASFKRALPLLQTGYIRGAQVDDAKQILLACSLTYVASSLLSVLHFWPWLGRSGRLYAPLHQTDFTASGRLRENRLLQIKGQPRQRATSEKRIARHPAGDPEGWVRRYGKPLIRSWLRLAKALG